MSAHGRTVCLSLGTSRDNFLYEELATGIAEALLELGCISRRADQPTAEAFSSEVLLLIGAGKQFNAFSAPIAQLPREQRPRVILWLLEPLPPPCLSPLSSWLSRNCLGWPGPAGALCGRLAEGVLTMALRFSGWPGVRARHMLNRLDWLHKTRGGWVDEVVTTTRAKARALEAIGIFARFCPMGYAPVLGRDLHGERDIDVLFVGGLGSEHARRGDTLERVRVRCQHAGLRFEVSSQSCHGEERERLVNRAKIFLNIAKYPWDLSIERFLIGAGAGALVVSEALDDATPFVAGEHYVAGPLEELPALILHWLARPEEAARVVANARALVTGELALERCLARLLTATNSSPAPVALASPPAGHPRPRP